MSLHVAARAVHILAGTLGIVFGFIALYAAKGARLHRSSGMLFVYAMLTMGLLGSWMAAVWGRQPASNVPVGLLTAYLVTTGLTTVRPPARGSRWLELTLMILAVSVGIELHVFGVVALESPRGTVRGIPAVPFFIFGSVALLAAVGDLRLIRSGGARLLRGAPRLTRHLWRMCAALLIAAFSFFLGQSQVFPKPIRIVPLLATPPLLVVAALLYWLWRVRLKRFLRGIAGVDSPREIPDRLAG